MYRRGGMASIVLSRGREAIGDGLEVEPLRGRRSWWSAEGKVAAGALSYGGHVGGASMRTNVRDAYTAKSRRVTMAMLQGEKLDIAALTRAYADNA